MSYAASSPSLIPVGSLAVLNVDVEKIEDQKLYMSCVAQSKDQQTIYAKSSGKQVLQPPGPVLPPPAPEQTEGNMLRSQSQAGVRLFSLGQARRSEGEPRAGPGSWGTGCRCSGAPASSTVSARLPAISLTGVFLQLQLEEESSQ